MLPRPEAHSEDYLGDLETYAIEVFGDPLAAEEWMKTPLDELDNRTPTTVVRRFGAAGYQQARDVLLRLEYGVYS